MSPELQPLIHRSKLHQGTLQAVGTLLPDCGQVVELIHRQDLLRRVKSRN